MEAHLVSVIVAVKNGERYLKDALDSILAQTYRNYEIIVVDGRSADKTEQIARSYENVRFITQSGKGIANAYNSGIDAARGEIVAFLSHDDLWTPNKLAVQVDALACNPQLQYVVAKVRFFLEEGCSIPAGFKKELLEGEHIGHIMETLTVRKSLFDLVGRFNTEYKTAEDTEWFARAIDRNISMAVVPETLLCKRVHNDNLSLSDIESNNRLLLKALRDSIKRKQGKT